MNEPKYSALQFEGKPISIWMIQSTSDNLRTAYAKGVNDYLNAASNLEDLHLSMDCNNSKTYYEDKLLAVFNLKRAIAKENRMIDFVINHKSKFN